MPFGTDLDYIITITREALAEIQDEITGQIIHTAQAIEDVWEIDCEGDWILYVKTALTAAGAALWLLLTPSLEEILESYLEPKPGRRHGRRGQRGDRNRRPNPVGQRRLYFGSLIPDVDNAIADAIPGRQALAGRRVGPGEYLFWRGIDVADRLAWYWLLIEASETFATVWQSEIIKSERCNALSDANMQLKVVERPFGGPPWLWQGLGQTYDRHSENFNIGVAGFVDLPVSNAVGHALIICEITCTMVNVDTEDASSMQFGPLVLFPGSGPGSQPDIEELTTISAPPGGTTTATATMARLVEDFHSCSFQLKRVYEAGSGGFTDSFESRTAIQVRSLRLV